MMFYIYLCISYTNEVRQNGHILAADFILRTAVGVLLGQSASQHNSNLIISITTGVKSTTD